MRTWWIRGAIALSVVAALFFGGTGVTYLAWNGESLGRTISGWVSGSLEGRGGPRNQAFTIGRARWRYLPALRSIVFGGPMPFEAWEFGIYDVEGHEVIYAPRVTGRLDLGRLVWHQLYSMLPTRATDVQLHFSDLEVDQPRSRIATLAPGPTGRVNLIAAFTSKHPPPRGAHERGGIVISLERARLHDARFAMAFTGWHAEIEHIEGEVDRLRYSSFSAEQEPGRPAFTWRMQRMRAPTARLTLGGAWEFPLENLDVTRFQAIDPERQHLAFTARATSRGALVVADGRLTDTYGDHPGVDMQLDFEHGAGLLAMLQAGDVLGGDVHGDVAFRGPFSHVTIDGAVDGGIFRVAHLAATSVHADLHIAGSRLALAGLRGDLGGGHIGGAVDIDLSTLGWKARLRSDGIDPGRLAPLVPAPARPWIAGHLDGTAQLAGTLAIPSRVRVHGIDARLARSARDRLPRTVDVHGALGLAPDRVALDGLRLDADGLATTFRGHVDPDRRQIEADLDLEGHGLAALLGRLGLPHAVQTVQAKGHVSGDVFMPAVEASARATGVGLADRRLSEVTARVRFARGRLDATEVRGEGFGGEIAGEVSLGLFDGPFSRRLSEPALSIHLAANRVRVHTLLDLPDVRGEITGQVDVEGTLAHPKGQATLDLPELTIYGDPYRNGRFKALIDDRGLDIERLEMERAGGGRFSIAQRGRVGWDRSLDLDVRPREFPLRAIPQLRDSPVALDGVLSGAVHIGGALGEWIPQGLIAVTKVTVREVVFGDGQLELTPTGSSIRVAGRFYNRQGVERFRVDGSIRLVPHVAGDLTVSFVDLPLEELIPEMRKLAEVRSLATGSAHFDFDISEGLSAGELHLSRLLVTFADLGDDAGASPGAIREDQLRNIGDVVVKTDGRSISFESLHLGYEGMEKGSYTRIGDLDVHGFLAGEGSDLRVKGQLDLRLLEFFAARLFQHTHGHASADVRLTGRMAHPTLTGRLDLEDAELEPRGADRKFRVPGGRLQFDENGLRLSHLRMQLDGAEAVAEGRLAVDWPQGRLGDLELSLSGEMSATLLAWIFPDYVSETAGRFGVALRVTGPAADPRWDGRLDVRDIAFHLKRLGRDVQLTGGTARMHGFDIVIGCPERGAAGEPGCRSLTAQIDERSTLQLDGTLGLRGGILAPDLGAVRVRINGDNLEWGSAGVFTVTLSPRVVLEGSGEQLRLSGQVNLVSGRYYQNFDFNLKDLIIQPRTVETEAPFYEDLPLLENLALDLSASASGPLYIKNNLADLNLMMPSLHVTGTLGAPALDGTVYVEAGGRFNLPLLRADFTSEQGSITFEDFEDFPDRTPRLDLRAGTDWPDRYDQVRHINLMVKGTYREPELDLSSSDGWDKSRVLIALTAGVTVDDLRRSAVEPGRAGTTSSYEGYVKTLSGQLLRRIEDPLLEVTRFDLVRLELGLDSVFVKLCPINRPWLKLCGTGDVGFVSTTRYDAKGELKVTDYLSLVGTLEHIEYGVDTSEDVVNRFRGQLSLRRPLF